jgi:DNA-directed RNA polymerase specialized sigma24 family protein
MRVINSKRKFIARIFNKNIYVDTGDGTGFHEVLEEMKGTMCKLASRSPIQFEDFYQDLCVAMLEGILVYNPSKNTSLSTFLYKICYYKLIDAYKRKNVPTALDFDVERATCCTSDQEKIEVMQCTQNWDDRWKRIMFRLFVEGEQINNVAQGENITPWGLTRAVRRKLLEARNFSRKRK